jgi:hypothetical protein
MNQLLDVTLAFPTVILTIVVGIALIYWLFVILGALDIDIVGDADVGDAGGADVGDAGGGDAGDADADAGGQGGGVWAALGLGKVPLTISISLIAFFAWVFCVVLMIYLGDLGLPRWLVGSLVFAGSLVLAVPPAALLARPLAPVFVVRTAMKRADIIGMVCTVTTGKVMADFGQARLEDGGNDLLIQVRCDRSDVFSRHDKALIIDWDEAREAYLIEAMDSVLGKKDES